MAGQWPPFWRPLEVSARGKGPARPTQRPALPDGACKGNSPCLVLTKRPIDSEIATYFTVLNGCMFRHKLCVIRPLERVEMPLSLSSNIQNRVMLGEMPHFSEKYACTLERKEIWLWLGITASSIEVNKTFEFRQLNARNFNYKRSLSVVSLL
jgi:hypothetical protein